MSNPVQILGAVAGGVIGFFVGGPAGAAWGFQIGLAAGSLISPTKLPPQYGPRLEDVNSTKIEIGTPVMEVFGVDVVPGTFIWLGPVTEHENVDKQGKGASQETYTYTYTQSGAIGVCKYISDDASIARIWENGEVVYDLRPQQSGETDEDYATRITKSAEYAANMEIYQGDQAQSPDPTIESFEGAGNVPAYLGLMYIVFTEKLLRAEHGNRWPNFQIELDSVPLFISSPTPSGTLGSSSAATVGATTTKADGTFYVVVGVLSELTGVTKGQIAAGQQANGSAANFSGNSAVTSGLPSVDITGLSGGQAYTYAMVQVVDGEYSNVLTGTFTTASAASITAGVTGAYIGYSLWPSSQGSPWGQPIGSETQVYSVLGFDSLMDNTTFDRFYVHRQGSFLAQDDFTSITINGKTYLSANATVFQSLSSGGLWTFYTAQGGAAGMSNGGTYPISAVI